jgi:GNAT superfamily N-acetyltransferase
MQIVPFEKSWQTKVVRFFQIQASDLHWELTANGDEEDIYNVHETYITPGGRFFVAIDRGQVVGTIGMQIWEDNSSVLLLRRFHVLRHYREKRYGSRLMDQAEQFARDEPNFEKIWLWFEHCPRSLIAENIYRSRGFVPVQEPLPVRFCKPGRFAMELRL